MADDDNENRIPDAGDLTHPLPSDMNDDGSDSTGGNAPFAPAHITPHDPESEGAQNENESKNGKHYLPGESYDAHHGDE